MRTSELPVLFTAQAVTTLQMTPIDDGTGVILRNHSRSFVPYAIAVVPSVLAKAAAFPWGRLMTEFQRPGAARELARVLLSRLAPRLPPKG